MKRAVPKLNGHHDAAGPPGAMLSAFNGGDAAEAGAAPLADDEAQVLRAVSDDVEVGNALQAYLRDIR
ncbi:hypothetical protein Q5O12_28700, partial [Klebsiella pneumoniae]